MAGNSNEKGKFGQPLLQLSLRDQLSLDPTDLLKVSMQEAIRGSGLSRGQMADEMNRLASVAGMEAHITETILDKWVARGSKCHVIPVRYLPIFCQAAGSISPLKALLPPGSEIISGEDVSFLRWARAEAERRKISKKARQFAREAGI